MIEIDDIQTNSKEKLNLSHIKRPLNAFMVWSKSHRKVLVQKTPNLHNSEISKSLGFIWKNLTDEQKKPFIDEAKRLRDEHRKEHPNYKFCPKKRNSKQDFQDTGSFLSSTYFNILAQT
jgi:hypothetical protein